MVAAADADRELARAVESGAVPGLVALAADERGVTYQSALGKRALGGHAAMTPDTVVWIASMTKPVTSVAAMQLVERGRIGLDEPLAPRVPDLAAVQVLEGFDAAGAPRLRPPRRAVTLRHLLTHTAGFAYPFLNADLWRFQEQSGGSPDPLRAPTVFDPGERWEYGYGTDWVGRVVEHLADQPLERYFREQILDPLGMADTSFEVGARLRARLAGRHERQPDGSLQLLDVEVPERPSFYAGGGGLYSTGPDYARFVRMLIGGGELDGARLLRAETLAEMMRNQIGDLTFDPDWFPGVPKRFGLGGMINTAQAPNGRSAGSWAWAGAANTYFWVDPARRVGGLLLTQILPFADAAVLDLFGHLERAVYAPRGG
jgi:CubicO group peptidase (beta-lactamase class C family)